MLFKDDTIQKAHKYIRRWKKGDGWRYEYPSNMARRNSNRKSERGIIRASAFVDAPLVDASNQEEVNAALDYLETLSNKGELRRGNLQAIFNREKFEEHLHTPHGEARNDNDTVERVKYLRFIPEVWKSGSILQKSATGGGTFVDIVARARVNEKVVAIRLTVVSGDDDGWHKRKVLSVRETKKAADNDSLSGGLRIRPEMLAVAEPFQEGSCKSATQSIPFSFIVCDIHKIVKGKNN